MYLSFACPFRDRYKVTDYIQRNKLVIQEIDAVDKYARVLPLGVPTGCGNLFLLVMLENHEKKQVEEVYSCDSAYVMTLYTSVTLYLWLKM